jgi:hypothetical protein
MVRCESSGAWTRSKPIGLEETLSTRAQRGYHIREEIPRIDNPFTPHGGCGKPLFHGAEGKNFWQATTLVKTYSMQPLCIQPKIKYLDLGSNLFKVP